MHIEYRISEKDYRAAALLALRKRTSLSSLEYYGPYLFCIVWIGANVIPSPLNNYLANPVDLLLTFGVVPIVVGFLTMRGKRIRLEYAKLKQFHLLQALDLDAAGLRLVTTAGTARSAWQVYSKFAEDQKTFILFMLASRSLLPIPKSQLSTGEVDELRALLAARLPQV